MGIIIKDNRIKDIIGLSRRAFGRYQWQIVLLTLLGFASGLLEAVGINAVIPLFSFIVGGEQGNDFISKAIRNFFAYLHVDFNLTFLLLFIVLMFVLKALAMALFVYIKIKINVDYEERTRNELFRSTLAADWGYLLRQKLGHLETILGNDVTRGAHMLQLLSSFIMIATGLAMYVAVALNISTSMTLLTLALGAVLFLFFKPLMYRTRMAAYQNAEMNKDIAHYVSENVLGAKTVKSMFAGGAVAKKGADYFSRLKELKRTVFMLSSVASILVQPVSLIFICIVFIFSYRSPNFSFAVLAAIVYLIERMFQYIQQLQGNLHAMNEAVPYLKSVLEHGEHSALAEERDAGRARFSFIRALEFKDVSFAYAEGAAVLRSVNFAVRKGEMVGLIGRSGAGKTTIVDLLLRLFKPEAGVITLDGRDFTDISLKEWRKNVGYVSQDIFLANDTVASNIRFYDNSLAPADIEKAAVMANIYDVIQELPNGFETVIGERGIMLSAGQRQRVIIARVLARNPEILILDEATSALDNESEAKIQKVIDNLKGKVTVLVVAHRLSTIMNADRLLALEDGKITEQGTPKELLADKKSYFYKSYNIRK